MLVLGMRKIVMFSVIGKKSWEYWYDYTETEFGDNAKL